MMSVSVKHSAPVPGKGALDGLYTQLAQHMSALDVFLREQVDQFEPEIRDMAAYCIDTTGKRLRPTMVFICGWRSDSVVMPELVRAAGVVEMVHLATLVHDDIMDQAEIRRNRRTASRQFGADTAVLLGDALFSQALHIASQFPTTDVCRLVSESTRKVCSGEIMQTLRRRDVDISIEDYRRMIDLKTGELFQVSCFLGASLSKYEPEFSEAAGQFGHHLGIAYQIYDDLVDFLGEEQQIGKTLGTDLATGKLTLPLMILLERVSPEEKTAMLGAFREGHPLGLASSRKRMQELGVVESVLKSIDLELTSATNTLVAYESLPPVKFMRQLLVMLQSKIDSLPARPV